MGDGADASASSAVGAGDKCHIQVTVAHVAAALKQLALRVEQMPQWCALQRLPRVRLWELFVRAIRLAQLSVFVRVQDGLVLRVAPLSRACLACSLPRNYLGPIVSQSDTRRCQLDDECLVVIGPARDN
jgi:hypothetical protein